MNTNPEHNRRKSDKHLEGIEKDLDIIMNSMYGKNSDGVAYRVVVIEAKMESFSNQIKVMYGLQVVIIGLLLKLVLT